MKSMTKYLFPFIIVGLGFLRIGFSQNLNEQNLPPAIPPDPIILITGIDSENTNNLIFKFSTDSTLTAQDTLRVHHKNYVNWIIMPNSGVRNFKEISMKDSITGNSDIFTAGWPRPVDRRTRYSNIWSGKVFADSSNIGRTEHYKIIWFDNDGNQHTFDPIIEVNQ